MQLLLSQTSPALSQQSLQTTTKENGREQSGNSYFHKFGGKTYQPYQQNSCAAIYRTMQQHSMAASSEQRGGAGGGGGGRGRSWSGVTFLVTFFHILLLTFFCAAHLCVFTVFHFFNCFTFCHSCVFVVFGRFWLKTANFPDSAPFLGKK